MCHAPLPIPPATDELLMSYWKQSASIAVLSLLHSSSTFHRCLVQMPLPPRASRIGLVPCLGTCSQWKCTTESESLGGIREVVGQGEVVE